MKMIVTFSVFAMTTPRPFFREAGSGYHVPAVGVIVPVTGVVVPVEASS